MRNNNFKLRILFFMLLSIVIIKTNAQTGLNFQGVARTSNNVILASQAITIKLSILQGSATGTADYSEIRRVNTNAQGLFTAVIGDTGAISSLGNFATINWKLTPKFLKIEMDPAAGSNFITMGTTPFQYVAYAQFAKSVDAENIVGIVPVTLGGTGVASMASLKTALTLNNVSNTADLSKPISTLTQTALDLKLNAADTSKYTKQTYSDSSLLTKLKISDTAAMLSRRIDRDTLSLSNRINSKISPSDSVLFQNDIKINGISIGVGSGIASATSTNVLIGKNALKNNTDGYWNTAIGYESLKENTTGGSNTSIGSSSLSKNTTGASNTATGSAALLNNTTGSQNTAIGRNTLLNNTSGNQNTAIGAASLYSNTTGTSNTATGQFALFSNTTGTNNTAIGQNALSKNTTGNFNTALSSSVLNSNTEGGANVAIGNSALFFNTLGNDNTAVGNVAIGNNINGDGNTAIGRNALDDIRTGNNNTAVGKYSGTLGDLSNTVAIGYNATATASNTIQLGDNNITDVKTYGKVTATGFKTPNGTSEQYLKADGSTDVTVTVDAGTLTGTTLKSTVTGSSLATVGTITSGVWSGTAVAVEKGGTGLTSPGANGNVLTSNGTAWISAAPSGARTHTLGEAFGGGIIFYVTSDGLHGLIAETQNLLSKCFWMDAQNEISKSSNHSTAGKLFSDWRLPTANELDLLLTYNSATGLIPGLNSWYYWSSTEASSSTVRMQGYPSLDKTAFGLKYGTDLYEARPIRAF
jgi:hypothetical protein